MDADIVQLGAATLVNGVPTWQASTPVGDSTSDVEPLGNVDSFQALGFDSMPAAADGDGYAEAAVLRGCGGLIAICVGGRDTRNADIKGKLGPGDSCMYATGPGAVSQVQCKAKKRQVVLATKDSKDRTISVVIDGKNDKIQITGLGAMIEVDPDGNISIINKSGKGLLIQEDGVHIRGAMHLGGLRPGFALMQAPQSGSPGGAGAVPMFPVAGVSG